MAARSSRARRLPGVQAHDRRFRRSRGRGDGAGRVWPARLWLGLEVLFVTAAVALGGWRAHDAVTTSHWFTIREVHVEGVERLSRGEVDVLLDGLRGRNALVTALDPWRDRLLASPWVKDVAIRRALPDAVHVTIVERHPVAIARVGRELLLVDEDGTFIDAHGPRYATLDLPLVDGISDEVDGEGIADPARMSLAAAALRDLSGAGLVWRISQLDVAHEHDAVVLMNDDPALLHLGHHRFAERLQTYLDMSRRLQTLVAGLEYVDLRFDDRVYVRPRKAGLTFLPAAPAADDVLDADVADEPNQDMGQQ